MTDAARTMIGNYTEQCLDEAGRTLRRHVEAGRVPVSVLDQQAMYAAVVVERYVRAWTGATSGDRASGLIAVMEPRIGRDAAESLRAVIRLGNNIRHVDTPSATAAVRAIEAARRAIAGLPRSRHSARAVMARPLQQISRLLLLGYGTSDRPPNGAAKLEISKERLVFGTRLQVVAATQYLRMVDIPLVVVSLRHAGALWEAPAAPVWDEGYWYLGSGVVAGSFEDIVATVGKTVPGQARTVSEPAGTGDLGA